MVDDCRKFLSELEKKKKLKKIEVPVDRDWEISCVARLAAEFPPNDRFGILFNNVRGSKHPVLINAFASREMYAIGLGTTVEGIQDAWQSALQRPLEPELDDSGSCKDNILIGNEVDLNIFPHIVSTPQRDPAPYITAGCVVTKDPETGSRNVGIYRLMVKGKHKLGIHIAPTNDGATIYSKHEERDSPMEVAIAIGAPPAVCMVGTTRVPFGTDELAVAGALGKSPLKIVKCETVDLEVPANAEIVIEGEVSPKFREPEAPFGEFYGYMGDKVMNPVINVKAITYRNNPIYHVLLQQTTPCEGTLMKDLGMEAVLIRTFKNVGILGVTGVHLRERSSGECLVVGIKKFYHGHVQAVAQACMSAFPILLKQIIVVDWDCNIFDWADVEWRMAACVQPDRDVQIFTNCAASALDPSVVKERRKQGSKMCIDATRKFDYPDVALPPKEMLLKARQQWRNYGLPDF
ncbi:MAG: UbiD family decarboxylase [Methanobacteriota archaeon]